MQIIVNSTVCSFLSPPGYRDTGQAVSSLKRIFKKKLLKDLYCFAENNPFISTGLRSTQPSSE